MLYEREIVILLRPKPTTLSATIFLCLKRWWVAEGSRVERKSRIFLNSKKEVVFTIGILTVWSKLTVSSSILLFACETFQHVKKKNQTQKQNCSQISLGLIVRHLSSWSNLTLKYCAFLLLPGILNETQNGEIPNSQADSPVLLSSISNIFSESFQKTTVSGSSYVCPD